MDEYHCQGCSQPMTPETLLVCACDHLALFSEPINYAFCSLCYWAHLESWSEIDGEHASMEKLH